MDTRAQNAWEKFMQSGKINDYVTYITLQNTTAMDNETIVSQGEVNKNANNDTGLGASGNQYR